MSDKKVVVLCIIVGLILAFAVSAPLRYPKRDVVGTPLHGGRTMGANPLVALDRPVPAETANKVYAEGQIELAPALSSQAGTAAAVFIMAKAPGMKGAPLAVKKIDHPSFPLSFELTQEDSMMGDQDYDGDLVVTARLDQDGSVGPAQPGDVEVSVELKKGVDRRVTLKFSSKK